jgi:DNA (cytosine-5)-methyltransferase 1
MVKLHRACQDNYYSTQFLESENPYEYIKKVFTKSELQNHNIRKLTPKEALKLQGFSEDFYRKAHDKGISNHQLLKQAGNAASVNVIYAILYYLIIVNDILGEK